MVEARGEFLDERGGQEGGCRQSAAQSHFFPLFDRERSASASFLFTSLESR
jgi:hypothetical protein